jgi:hypothetical protein
MGTVSRWSRTRKLVAVLAVVAAPLTGCGAGGSGRVGTAPSSAAPSSSGPSAVEPAPGGTPTGSPGASAPPAPSGEPTPPGATAVPGPDVTLTGDLVGGVEPNCVLMRSGDKQYLLLGGNRSIIKPDTRVTVRGRVVQGIMTTCQQGIPFQVVDAGPA